MKTARALIPVINGAKVMNVVYGPSWKGDINKDTLEIYSSTNCILGQLDGDFDEGINHLVREGYLVRFADDDGKVFDSLESMGLIIDIRDHIGIQELDDSWKYYLGLESEIEVTAWTGSVVKVTLETCRESGTWVAIAAVDDDGASRSVFLPVGKHGRDYWTTLSDTGLELGIIYENGKIVSAELYREYGKVIDSWDEKEFETSDTVLT